MSKFFEEITQEISEKKYQQGIQQGVQQGIHQGEQNQKLMIAKSLLLNGFTVEVVVENTALEEETVTALRDELIH